MQSIALNMIVKNEEQLLSKALESVHGIVDEIVIVDTGSTDDSITIARRYGATVIPFEWGDDFSAARNAALKATQSQWILPMDADESLPPISQKELQNLKGELQRSDVCYWSNRILQNENLACIHMRKVLLFPNREELFWKFRVHEQLVCEAESVNLQHQNVEIPLLHQRENESNESLEKKWLYYYELLKEDLKTHPGHRTILYHLGQECHNLKRYDEAIAYLAEAFDKLDEESQNFYNTVYYLVNSLFMSGQVTEGWKALRNARDAFPENLELLHFEAALQRTYKRADKATALWYEIIRLTSTHESTDKKIDPVAARNSARLNIAEIFLEQGKDDQARELWKAVLEEIPENRQAKNRLEKAD